jgi:hypothetical protein
MMNYIVGTTNREIIKQTSEVSFLVESLRLTRIDGSDLVHVEDLDVVANSLRANNGIVVEHADLTPG